MEPIYTIVDVETTGGYRDGNKITEVAIVKTNGREVLETFSTLINPERSIPYGITKLTGITNEMVYEAPKFYEVAKKIVEMTEGCVFVAHNVFFDYNFFQREFNELGYSFKRDKLCTVRMSRKAFPGLPSYSLKKLCNSLSIDMDRHHRALDDAVATSHIFHRIFEETPSLLEEFSKRESKKMALPADVERDRIDQLPETPGVYYFFNKADALLYIGKSKNIRRRVLSHFRVDVKNKRDLELKGRVSRIEFQEMGNELSSLLFECHEIKQKRPHYNRKLRRRRYKAGLYLATNENGEVEIKASYKGEFEEFKYLYSSSQKAIIAINSFYRSFLGVDRDSMHFEEKKAQLIKVLGLEAYNKMVEKSFASRMTNATDYSLELPGRGPKEKCEIVVKDRYPRKIIYQNEEGIVEKFSLIKDEDLKYILFKNGALG